MDKSTSSNDSNLPADPVDALEDNVKRWIIVNMCLHNYISPKLRTYVKAKLVKQYKSLVKSHNIDKQTYPAHHTTLPISDATLNYATINNNKHDKAACRKKKGQYNYNVKNAVDLSKLFLQPYLADYTKFDSKCDTSALLGLITIIKKFPRNVREEAEKIRDSVRNETAHPDFEIWDIAKFAESFTLLKSLVTNLSLDPVVTNTVIGNLNIWEANGISKLNGTPLGLELYRNSCSVWKNKNLEIHTKLRNLEGSYERLKRDVDILTKRAKTNSVDNERKSIEIERQEYELRDFPRADELQLILKESLDMLEKEDCIPCQIHDVINKRPQVMFCYHQGTGRVDYRHFSVKKLGTSIEKTESIGTSPLTTVCIVEGTPEGKLSKLDIHVLKALLDLPKEYMSNMLFIVRNSSYDIEQLNHQVLLQLSEEISSVLKLGLSINTVYGRLFPYDHADIGSRISMSFQRQMLDKLLKLTDQTLKDIRKSEQFLTSLKINEYKTVLTAKNGPFSTLSCSQIVTEVVRQKDLESFVLVEFEKKLRSKLIETLIPNVPTHSWADLSRRTRSNTNLLKNYKGYRLSSKFYNHIRSKCFELRQDDNINQEIIDCRDTHLKRIRKIKELLEGPICKVLDNRHQVNENDSQYLELNLILTRFDPKSKLKMGEDEFIIYLPNLERQQEKLRELLSSCFENLNNITFKKLQKSTMKKYTGTLQSGDRIQTGRLRHSFCTASFFLRDLEWYYLVSCQHIVSEGKLCYIEYANGKITEIKHLLKFEDIDMMVCQIMNKSITCKSGFRNDSNLDSRCPFDGHVFSQDMISLPFGSEVYKWGAASGLTKGKFAGVVLNKKNIEVLIEEDRENPFAVHGDSGSLICFKTELKTVYAAFVLIGASIIDEQSKTTGAYVCVRVQDVLSRISKQLPKLELTFSANELFE